MLLLFILVYVFPILKWKTLIYCFKALPYLREQLYLWMISIKAVNKVQYQWGKYCMINICSLDELTLFFSFYPLAPNWCLPYSFYNGEICFFLSFWECGTKDLGFFLCPMLETRCEREKFAFPLPSSKIPIFLIQIL